jgi:hypothetical protein
VPIKNGERDYNKPATMNHQTIFSYGGKIKEGVNRCMGNGGIKATRSYRAHPRFFLTYKAKTKRFV